MAETAPLPAAHGHARKAAVETQQANWSIAAEEHKHAAVDFARAARSTSDTEALRVLKLLEDQHQKLARIIRSQDTADSEETIGVETKHAASPSGTMPHVPTEPGMTTNPKPATSTLATARIGSQVRDSSPTLVRDIASRRGIPQPGRNPPSAAAQARARHLSPESSRRNRLNPNPKASTSVVDSQVGLRDKQTASRGDDDAFAKFYSNLTTGTMSKLSHMMAYAGLPLSTEEPPADQSSRPKIEKRTVTASHDPDVKKIFSKAALDAIEDEHRKRGAHGHVFGPAESFYVVQRGGGTYSYADIAKAQQQQLGGIDEDDEQDFEDAREAQAPSPPRQPPGSNQARNSFGKSRTHEELELENVTLKQTLEQVAQRLSEFESHAQDASMAALTQSMISNPGVNTNPSTALLGRFQQLEKQLQEQAQAKDKLQGDLEKKDKTIKKYKSMFEEIKKSAKEKDKAKKEKARREAAESNSVYLEAT